jgi:RNA polymerase sigma factor (sigma-70 family)
MDTLMSRMKAPPPSSTSLDADELLHRARRLDSLALGELHDRFYPEVYAYAAYRLGDELACRDVAAEVFLRFLEALHHRRRWPKRNARAWLLGAAARLVDERLGEMAKKTRRGAAAATRLEVLPDTGDEGAALQQRLRMALARLAPDQQHFLALRFSQALSLEEVAALMELDGSQARALQYRALAALARLPEAAK